jgi:type IV pilus assembly protein PilO
VVAGAEVSEQFYARPDEAHARRSHHQVAKFFYGVSQLDRIINLENVMLTSELHGEDVLVTAETLATAFRAVQEAGPADTGDKRGDAINRGG